MRLWQKKTRWFLIVLFFALSIVLWRGFFRSQNFSRFTVAIAGEPSLVWSWDSTRNRSVLVALPSRAMIESVGGYGTYSVSSLWKLGDLDANERNIFSQSIGETVGISVPWYVGRPTVSAGDSSDQPRQDPLGIIKDFFSFSSITRYFGGSYRTNISPFLFVRMVSVARNITPHTTVVIDGSAALVRTDLPDGSQAQSVNVGALDGLIAHEFEDQRVRREALPVGVYNTTGIATLGSRFARRLGHMGAMVLLVDNSVADVTSVCEIHGTDSALKSYTVERIMEEFGCTQSGEIDGYEGVDLAVLLGRDYAKEARVR